MSKKFFPLIALILFACGEAPSDPNKTPREEAVILQDSALKIMKEGTDTQAMEKSIALLNQAIEKDPQLKSAYFHKMNIYKNSGNEEGIFQTLVESNDNNPNDAYTTLNLGMEYEDHGEIEKANTKYKQAVILFQSALDTIPQTKGLIRNTYIMNLAMAETLANQEIDPSELSKGMDEAEIENLRIALNTMKGMTREDILNLRKNGQTKKD